MTKTERATNVGLMVLALSTCIARPALADADDVVLLPTVTPAADDSGALQRPQREEDPRIASLARRLDWILGEAAQDLGLTLVETEEFVEVRGYQSQAEKSKLIIRASDHYDIGLKETEVGYEFVADWWGIEMETGLTQEQVVNKIQQRYAYHKVVKEVQKKGFTLEEEVEEDEEIKLTVRRWE